MEIGHKLRAFVSSKCGGKYAIARKALKALLEATGLVEVYAFETEPASSENTKSAYLESIDESNLCIFLVDNGDGVPAAVLSEEKRAKDRGLRLIYIFCDETKKEPIPMQQEIRDNLTQKYSVVHEFSDIVEKAYLSVLQDLIVIYRRRAGRYADVDNEELPSSEPPTITPLSQGVYSLEKGRYPSSAFVTHTLMKGIMPLFSSEEKLTPSDLEKYLATQLNVILSRTAFHEDAFISLKTEVLSAQNPAIIELIEKRLDAQKLYFQAEYEDCLKQLQNALSISIKNECIPTWLANDVAIDIRHVFAMIDDLNNCVTLDNPGQKFIQDSKEYVFYPQLDRHVGSMQEAIANRYYTELSSSPYSIQYGGLDGMFKNLAGAFCIAQMHGSIIQTVICKDRLISVTSMLSTLYDNHEFSTELIRLLIINQDSKKLDYLIRTYNQSVEIINEVDIKRIIESIACISDQIRMYKSKYLLISRLGYYMNEEQYQELYNDLVAYAMNWIQSDTLIISLSGFIFDFFRENTIRSNLDHIADFIVAVFNYERARFYHECFRVLQNIDYSRMSLVGQRKIRTILINVLSGKYTFDIHSDYLDACTRFCKSATVPFKQIENSIAKNHSNYYSETFELEMSLERQNDPTKFISIYLDHANSRNETQGKNGTYAGYAYEPYDVIYNIITFSQYHISKSQIDDILTSTISTLAEQKQTVSAKISALKLIHLLYYTSSNTVEWERIKQQIICNRDIFTSGHEIDFFTKNTISTLTFTYDLLISCFDPVYTSQVIEDIFSIDQRDSLSIVRCMDSIADYLKIGIGNILDVRILDAFLHYSVLMVQHREREIKYHATKCLVSLTGFDSTCDLALKQLSQIMNSGSQAAKTAILLRVGDIKYTNDSFVEQIFNKGKADSNYLIRFVAEREYQKREKAHCAS